MGKVLINSKVKPESFSFWTFFPYFFIFFARSILGFLTLQNIAGTIGSTSFVLAFGQSEEMARNLAFLISMNLFTFYIIIKSLISSNIYQVYASFFIMLQNFCFMVAYNIYSTMVAKTAIGDMHVASLIFALANILLYVFEIFWLGVYIYRNKSINQVKLFKQIGLNENINKAFAARKYLKVFGSVMTFLGFAMLFRSVIWIGINSSLEIVFGFLLALTTSIHQLLIYSNFTGENKMQRKLAFVFSIINILVCTILVISDRVFMVQGRSSIFYTTSVLYLYIIFGNLLLLIALIQDYNCFGMGLKDYLKEYSEFIPLIEK